MSPNHAAGPLNTWPDWLADDSSLSDASLTLWLDALSLWVTQPVVGAGPGAFTPSSELASEIPSLASVHSLLQVGSELGAVGVFLLGAMFVAGKVIGKIFMTATDLDIITTVTYYGVQTALEEWEPMYDAYRDHVDLEQIAVQ